MVVCSVTAGGGSSLSLNIFGLEDVFAVFHLSLDTEDQEFCLTLT